MVQKELLPKWARVLWVAVRVLIIFVSLYFFICSLDLLATSGRLIAGKSAGSVFKDNEILGNPIVGLMIGILVTVLMQSSSTTTSIIVGLVAAKLNTVKHAIPMIMGANIGTSVTNTIVSITQIGDREEFKRAFACAVVHDFFNWMAVVVFFTLEVTTGYLERLTGLIVGSLPLSQQDKPPELLKALTKPLTKLVIQIDKKVLKGWSTNTEKYANITTLLKKSCKRKVNITLVDPEDARPLITSTDEIEEVTEKYPCGYAFASETISDQVLGFILLMLSIFVLTACLIILVKTLNSLMNERLARLVTKTINSDLPYVPWLTEYLVLLVGAVVTFAVQSSSVFTATITPLAGTGLISLQRCYALTMGANIGTTTTGLLAALTADRERLADALQIALCHLFFNISGIIIFFPLPFMRWPIPLARMMGNTVSKHRWFAIIYLILAFFLLPIYVFSLSLAGETAVYAGVIPIVILLALIILVNVLQRKRPNWLPEKLRDWTFLPTWMRSLKPYDKFFPQMNVLTTCKRVNMEEINMDGRLPTPFASNSPALFRARTNSDPV